MSTPDFDDQKAATFAERLIEVLNASGLSLMISIGHRTGLFDVMSALPPSTSVQISERSGLHERYVREWLAALTVGRVVIYDPSDCTYRLPAEHAAWLTRSSAPDNLAVYAQYIGVLGSVEDRIVECFQGGGGVAYEEYRRFHEIMAEDSGQTVLPVLIDHILPLAPGIVESLERGIDVLDIGCGSGLALCLMAERFPKSRFWGYDLSVEAIEKAAAEAARQTLRNLTFEVRDLTGFRSERKFDLICAFDAIHDQADPASVLLGVRDALKPDGVFLMQDIHASSHVHNNTDHPLGTLLYTISCMHCMTVSLAQGGAGLGAMWGKETALRMLDEAGFDTVSVAQLPHDIQNTYFVARPARAA